MSGGHYNYAFHKVENFADEVEADLARAGQPTGYAEECYPERENPTLRREFIAYLRERVIPAMKAIEWNDSGDGDDEEAALILAVLRGQS